MRTWKDGTAYSQVRFRHNGRKTSVSFNDHASALRFEDLVHRLGPAGRRLPRGGGNDHGMVFLSRGEFSHLLTEVLEPWRPMVEFLVAAGCRIGEATALNPSDVNRDAGAVTARQGAGASGEPASQRVVAGRRPRLARHRRSWRPGTQPAVTLPARPAPNLRDLVDRCGNPTADGVAAPWPREHSGHRGCVWHIDRTSARAAAEAVDAMLGGY